MGKRSRHSNVRLFHTIKLIVVDYDTVKYFLIRKILEDCVPKPSFGRKFKIVRDVIMNLNGKNYSHLKK